MLNRFNLTEFEANLSRHPDYAEAMNISNQLQDIGRVCWLAGGAVRDFYIGRPALDLDLVTDASDDEILKLFPNAVLVGQSFGVFKIPAASGAVIDLTVFREEDDYRDGRRPQVVRRSTPEKDAQRRDFTINALFWDLKHKKIEDYVQGVLDLEHGIIRCVGDAAFRFQEDHLRILRLLRFHAVLDFKMEQVSFNEALKLVDLLSKISGERIWSEILKMATSVQRKIFWSNPLGQKIAQVIGLQFQGNLWEKLAKVSKLKFKETDSQILFEIFYLCDFSEESAQKLKSRFKLSKKQSNFLETVEQEITRDKSALEHPITFEKYCLMCDRSRAFLEILDNMSVVGRFDQGLVERLKSYMLNRPPDLLEAKDLLNEIPHRFISRALVEIREQQLLGILQGKDHALAWIRRAVLDWT